MITGACVSVVQQLASYISDLGYSYEVSALVSSASLGLMAVGKLAVGGMYDKLGARTSTFIYGIVNVANSIGTAIGSPIAAAIFDSQGSYIPAWYLDVGVFCAVLLVLAVMFRGKRTAG